jgi:hypothetical protein
LVRTAAKVDGNPMTGKVGGIGMFNRELRGVVFTILFAGKKHEGGKQKNEGDFVHGSTS